MRLNVEVPEAVYEELQDRAESAGRSISDVVRELVTGWIRRERRADAELLTLDEQRRKRRTR